jgi:hypothetical protein
MEVWPWLERMGGRLVAFGQDPLHTSDEVVTLFAFRSFADWHRFSRPSANLDPPPEVVGAWNQRASLISRNRAAADHPHRFRRADPMTTGQLALFPDPARSCLGDRERRRSELARLGGGDRGGLTSHPDRRLQDRRPGDRAPRHPVSESTAPSRSWSARAHRRALPSRRDRRGDRLPRARTSTWRHRPGCTEPLNGFPFVACSIGVLLRAAVAGAIWCSSGRAPGPALTTGASVALAFEGITVGAPA